MFGKTMATRRRSWSWLAAALVAASVIGPAYRVGAQGVAERVGNGLDNAGRTIRHGVQNAFARTQNSVHNQDVLSRVYSRIHWEKTLVGSALELEALDGGTLILRGAVPDPAARRRAVLLARDTVGVNQVVDELSVIPGARVVPAAPVGVTETTTTTRTTVIKP